MFTAPSKPSRLPAPQTHFGTNNKNNKGVLGNGSGNIVSSGNFNNNQFNITQITKADEPVELDRLLDGYVSKDALHSSLHSPPECHTDTRKTVRKEIGGWLDDSGSAKSPLLWLNGPAGVGKSVIAKTIAGFHNQVVATFFFSTSSDRTAATLFPTLAWQLAWRIPETKQYIIASLKNNPSILTSDITEQFDLLLVQPLRDCTTTLSSPPVMVIDGIDECIDEYMLERFLRTLQSAGEGGNMPLRFIICSRPEPRIRAILEKSRDSNITTEPPPTIPVVIPENIPTLNLANPPNVLGMRQSLRLRLQIRIQSYLPNIKSHLYTVTHWKPRAFSSVPQEAWKLYRPMQLGAGQGGPSPELRDKFTDGFDRICFHPVISSIRIGFSEECREDIARYLTDKFNAIHQSEEDTSPWFQQCDISELVEKSCGQFLYASTIARLLDDHQFYPKDVLKMARSSSLPTPDLNKLYKAILKGADDNIRSQDNEGGPDYERERGALKDTLAILIVFAENVHVSNVRKSFPLIESLLGLEKGRMTSRLSNLHSVLSIVPGESISVYHRSFLEFLQNQKRSGEYCIPYPSALWRFLILLTRAVLRYSVMSCFGLLQADDNERLEHTRNMVLAFPRNFFRRSGNPTILAVVHVLIHSSLIFLFWVPFCLSTREFWESQVDTLTASFALSFILRYLLLIIFFLILTSGSFILSLTGYTSFINRSIIFPLFHPFLHPFYVMTVEFLLSLRPHSVLLFFFVFLSVAFALISSA